MTPGAVALPSTVVVMRDFGYWAAVWDRVIGPNAHIISNTGVRAFSHLHLASPAVNHREQNDALV